MVPACSNGILTNMLQTQDMTPNPVTVYRHKADLPLCYLLMWDVTLAYTTTHVLCQGRPENPSPTFHTHQQTLNLMMLLWW